MRRKSRSATKACPFKPGDRIRAVAMFEHHDYEGGRNYTVRDIDPNDSTLRALDENGKRGSWIRWDDCRSVSEIGWDWLKGRLPAESLELLSAFNGLERLKLRQDVTFALVSEIPSLKQRILGLTETLETTPKQP